MSSDPLCTLRDAVDAADDRDPATFARATRNAVAQAILAVALTTAAPVAPCDREPKEAKLRELLGPDVGADVADLLRGGEGWTGRAIDLLEPLHVAARGDAQTRRQRPPPRPDGMKLTLFTPAEPHP